MDSETIRAYFAQENPVMDIKEIAAYYGVDFDAIMRTLRVRIHSRDD